LASGSLSRVGSGDFHSHCEQLHPWKVRSTVQMSSRLELELSRSMSSAAPCLRFSLAYVALDRPWYAETRCAGLSGAVRNGMTAVVCWLLLSGFLANWGLTFMKLAEIASDCRTIRNRDYVCGLYVYLAVATLCRLRFHWAAFSGFPHVP